MAVNRLVLVALPFFVPTLSTAQVLSVPVKLEPKQEFKIRLSGAALNLRIDRLQQKKLDPKKEVEVGFQRDMEPLQHRLTGVVPVVLQDGEGNLGSRAFAPKDWILTFSRLHEVTTHIMAVSDKGAAVKDGKLADGEAIELTIKDPRIPAELSLPRSSRPVAKNPIVLAVKKAPSGGLIEYQFLEEPKGSVSVVFLTDPPRVFSLDVEPVEGRKGLWGTVTLPEVRFDSFWSWSADIDTVVLATDEAGRSTPVKVETITVTQNGWAIAIGLATLLSLLLVVWLVKAEPFSQKRNPERYQKWKDLNVWQRVARFPFHFAITPMGQYSISLTQLLFWTLVVVFAFAYVYASRGEFLSITGQMLILLGISGSTSLAAKVNAMARIPAIPDEYLRGIRKNRLPRFKSLLSIRDAPNIFKLQIFAFTLLAGVHVVRELLRTGSFPVLEDNLLTLMGISGGIYVANEVATETSWKEVSALMKEIDDKEKVKSELEGLETSLKARKEELEEVKNAVRKRLKTRPKHLDKLDKKREAELQDHIERIKAAIAVKGTTKTVETELDTLKKKLRTALERIYTESPS